MSYRGDPNNSTPPPEDLEAYEKIKANPLPILAEDEVQVVEWEERVLGSQGEVIIEKHTQIRKGSPELLTVESDLCDSYWYYPLVSHTISPEHTVTPTSHALWYAARKEQGLSTSINMRQINRKKHKLTKV